MALKAKIFKVRLNISDLDRGVFEDFALAVARHPSETDARMMLRLAAFALHADQRLSFGRGISTDDEPDLWLKSLSDSIELWIELGTPAPERLRKACGRSQQVILYAYGERSLRVWWEKHSKALARFENLCVYAVDDADISALGALASTGLFLQCTISGGELWLTDGDTSIALKPQLLAK